MPGARALVHGLHLQTSLVCGQAPPQLCARPVHRYIVRTSAMAAAKEHDVDAFIEDINTRYDKASLAAHAHYLFQHCYVCAGAQGLRGYLLGDQDGFGRVLPRLPRCLQNCVRHVFVRRCQPQRSQGHAPAAVTH